MDLDQLLDSDGLKQDDWTITKPKFGIDNQLTVVGWSGKCLYNKYYILKCNVCSEDVQLFGGGYFRCLKSHLLKSNLPCGCSRLPKWSEEQYNVLCERKASAAGYLFLGFEGNTVNTHTKVKMLCQEHGEWSSLSINNLLHRGYGCIKCTVESRKKPDNYRIKSFFASGAFHPDTKFWRSERRSKSGESVYWGMLCGECGEQGESTNASLERGKRPCICSKQRQTEAYINWIVDNKNNLVAIKFGISRDSSQRVKDQDRNSVYNIIQYRVYKFPSSQDCKRAEREIKESVNTKVVVEKEMQDGWTETTDKQNLLKIIEIYCANGGKLILENNL